MTLQFVSSEVNHAQGPPLQSFYCQKPAKNLQKTGGIPSFTQALTSLTMTQNRISWQISTTQKLLQLHRVEKGNVLGWQLNDEGHNEHGALLFYICNVLCLSSSCHRSPVDKCGGGMRATTKCMFHCSGVREPELLSQELHSDNVSLKGREGMMPAHQHQLC